PALGRHDRPGHGRWRHPGLERGRDGQGGLPGADRTRPPPHQPGTAAASVPRHRGPGAVRPAGGAVPWPPRRHAPRATDGVGGSDPMRLTVLGCAGSFPGPDSPCSSYLVEADDFRLLLDFGTGSLSGLQRYASLTSVDAILLTHLHADHILDACSYVVVRRYAPEGPYPPLPLYGPAGTAA